MPWRGAEVEGEYPTLGFAILEALSDSLPSPADQETPLIFTNEQARLILRWYGLDERGDFIYRRGITEMAKGWGKSPLLASLAIAELALPVLFAGWDSNGEAVGRPWGTNDSPPPWVQIAAVSEDQTDNTYAVLYEMLVANDGKAATALGIDEGKTRLYLRGKPGRLEPVTASAGSREGQRLTFAVLDETHLWLPTNRGVKLARTIRRNAAKMGGRTFETTNAPELGEKSVAELSGSDAEAGEPGILYYAKRPKVEPDPAWTNEQMTAALDECYGDARWIDRDRIVAEIRDPATTWTDSLRFYFNFRVAGAGRAVDPRRWDELRRDDEVPNGTRIGLGFAAITTGATVLRGCTPEGHSFDIASWTRPEGPEGRDWKLNRALVNDAVAGVFANFKVGRMLCDPSRWRSEVEDWAALYGDEVVLAFATNQPRRFAPAVDRWMTALREGTHTHDGDDFTRQCVVASHLRKVRLADAEDDTRTMYVLTSDGKPITAAVADVLSLEAAATMGAPEERAVAIAWV